MKKIIAFDIDRTLVDSFWAELHSLQEALEHALNIKFTDSELAEYSHLTTDAFFASINLNEEQISLVNKEWAKTYPKYKTQIVCFPGIPEMIKKLHQAGYCINIITSRTKIEYESLSEILRDIQEYFQIIVTSDLVDNPKPAPDSMEYLCKRLGCNSKDVIYVGDSKSDEKFCANSNSIFIPVIWDNKELAGHQNACETIEELLQAISNVE